MAKRKWRKGPPIKSLDELARQEMILFRDKATHCGWFLSWQFRMAKSFVSRNDLLFYAMPAGVVSRYTDEEILYAERRLGTRPTLEGRTELIGLLERYEGDAIGRHIRTLILRGAKKA